MKLRFCFKQKEKMSNPWRIWDHKDELYISARNLGGLFKASIHRPDKSHPTNHCNFSFTRDYIEKRNIEPMPNNRHLGNEVLDISDIAMQIVFYIIIPINKMKECKLLKESDIDFINIHSGTSGTILVKIIHIPKSKQNLVNNDSIHNFLGSFCNGRYIITWSLDSNLNLNSFKTSNHIEFGNIDYDTNTRAITFGYSKDKKHGFFLDTSWNEKGDL